MRTNLTAIGLRAVAQALQLADATQSNFEDTPPLTPDPVDPQTAAAALPDAALAAQIAMTGAHGAGAPG